MSIGGVVLDGGCMKQNKKKSFMLPYTGGTQVPMQCYLLCDIPCPLRSSPHLFGSAMGWAVDRGQRFGHRHRAGEG